MRSVLVSNSARHDVHTSDIRGAAFEHRQYIDDEMANTSSQPLQMTLSRPEEDFSLPNVSYRLVIFAHFPVSVVFLRYLSPPVLCIDKDTTDTAQKFDHSTSYIYIYRYTLRFQFRSFYHQALMPCLHKRRKHTTFVSMCPITVIRYHAR